MSYNDLSQKQQTDLGYAIAQNIGIGEPQEDCCRLLAEVTETGYRTHCAAVTMEGYNDDDGQGVVDPVDMAYWQQLVTLLAQ